MTIKSIVLVLIATTVSAFPAESNKILRRERRSHRSYFYNYYDEIAMSTCTALSANYKITGYIFAVRRTCGGPNTWPRTCDQICRDPKLRAQGMSDNYRVGCPDPKN